MASFLLNFLVATMVDLKEISPNMASVAALAFAVTKSLSSSIVISVPTVSEMLSAT